MLRCALLLGPTASGKTSLCRQLIDLPVEIINADVLQMYQDLEIGNARPESDLLAQIPHHLMAFLRPEEEYSCGKFVRAANRLIASISQRGHWPLIVGGSPFYLRALLYGLPDIPPVAKELRQELSSHSTEELYQQLQLVDAAAAEQIHPNNRQRVLRALEVFRGTGTPLSAYQLAGQQRSDLDPLLLGVSWPREILYQRINSRLAAMVQAGFANELAGLRQQGYQQHTPAMKGIGYREFFQAGPEPDLTLLWSTIARNSRRLAKRQLTFYRRFDGIVWFTFEQKSWFRQQIVNHFRSAY